MPNLKNKLNTLRPVMAKAAQTILDDWQQDSEGWDEELGSGGICDAIANSLIDVIHEHLGIDAVLGAPEGDDHQWIVVSNGQEACIVDIPPSIYEIGSGYSWKKIPNVQISSQNILIESVSPKDVNDLFETNYVDDILTNMSIEGMTEELWQMAYDDFENIGKLKINDEKERNLYFYLDHFYDDLCQEFGFKIDAKEKVIEISFNTLKENKKPDLTDIRRAVYSAIRQISPTHKLAYPSGVMLNIQKPTWDVNKWTKTLGMIYSAVQKGESKYEVFGKLTEEWNPMEKIDFDAWARYYEEGNQNKYATYKVASPFTPEEEITLMEPTAPIEEGNKPGRPRKTTKTPNDIKLALISRLDSADKLLREFSQIWPVVIWNRLHSSLNDLKREVMTLKSASTMRDVIVKTAGIWAKEGWEDGAMWLQKLAEPPSESGDVTNEIEQALSGTRKEKAVEEPQPDAMGLSPEEMEAVPPAGVGEELPMPEPPLGQENVAPIPEDVALKPQEPAPVEVAPLELEEPPALEKGPTDKSSDINVEENPYEGSTIRDIVDVLEPVVLDLKERATARELAKIDMMLDSQGIASHFPELGEAMSKVLESNTYVVTRLDKLLTKIKGGAHEKEDNKKEKSEPVAPEIDMRELNAPALTVQEEALPKEAPVPQAPAPVATPATEVPALEVSETEPAAPTGVPLGKGR